MQIIQNNFNFLVTLIEVDEEETPLEKKVKTEGDNDDAIVWEWEDDGHVWKQFSSNIMKEIEDCLLYTSPSPRDGLLSRMPSSA